MTQHAPTPRQHHSHPSNAPAGALTRVRWDNIAIAGVGIVAVLGVATTLMSWASQEEPRASITAQAPAAVASTADPASTAVADANDLDGSGSVTDPTEVQALIVEARDFLAQGRWDEALDRLDTIAPEARAGSGAEELRTQVTSSREEWTTLDQALRSHVASLDWTGAKSDLAQLVAIAPLNDEQLALRDQVQAALAPRTAQPAASTAERTTGATEAKASAKPAAKPAPATATSGAESALAGLLGGGASSGGISKSDAAALKQLTDTMKDISAMNAASAAQ